MGHGQPPRPPREWLEKPGSFGQQSSVDLPWLDAPDEDQYRQLGAYNAAQQQNDMSNRIRLALREREQTYVWLGRKIGVSKALVSRILRGDTHPALWHVEGFYAVLPSARPKPVEEPKK